MANWLRRIFYAFLVLLICACGRDDHHEIDYELVRENLLSDPQLSDHHYLIDTIIEFFRKELPHQTSQRLSIGNAHHLQPLDALTPAQIDSLRDRLEPSTRVRYEIIKDSEFVDEEFLTDRIRHALKMAGEYPWNHTIPDSILINYLLPYKIIDEYSTNWWSFLEPHYVDSFALWSSPTYDRFDAEDTRWVNYYSTFIMGDLPIWWHYDDMATTYSTFPSLNEILLLRYGGCNVEAMINAMISRTWGIPTALEEIPYWGSQNGSHAAEAYWSPLEGKMVSDLYLPEINRRPSKVMRYTFRKTNVFSEQIRPYLNGAELQIPQMRGDQWFDVTDQHTPVSEVKYAIGGQWPDGKELGYIYVMNYGEWVPLNYGIVTGDSIRFRKMGVDIIYRVGYFDEGKHHMISQPFLLHQDGSLQYSRPRTSDPVTVPVAKYNAGSKATLDAGVSYTLQFLDDEGQWQDHTTMVSSGEEILEYTGVPDGAFYRMKFSSDTRNLARIFILNEADEQIWY